MTDIQPVDIAQDVSRLLDGDRFFETYQKSGDQLQYRFSELASCKLYDTSSQTPTTGTYTYQNMTQVGGFTYVSGVLTVPRSSYYYISNNLELGGGGGILGGDYYAHNTGSLGCNISVGRPTLTGLGHLKSNTNILKLEKGQTITISYTQQGAANMKGALYIQEINPLSIIIN